MNQKKMNTAYDDCRWYAMAIVHKARGDMRRYHLALDRCDRQLLRKLTKEAKENSHATANA
jgi:hypothetical protein